MSHPAWVCGLKHYGDKAKDYDYNVTPCVGVWIETLESSMNGFLPSVTPCVGVWIETIFFNLRACSM